MTCYDRVENGPNPADRTQALPQADSFDHATINQILDEALSCHMGFAVTVGRT
jgi:hypothetical protein